MKQHTIAKSISFSGIGQHKGLENSISLFPSDINTGIIFIVKGKEFHYDVNNVFGAGGFTCIGEKDGINLKTIEHLMSAVAGLGIDNLILKTDSEEMPILDGSSLPFALEIQKAGIIEQNAPKKFVRILKKVDFQDEKASVSIEPNDKDLLTLDVSIVYDDIPVIGNQNCRIDLTPENYLNFIAPARTYARMKDVDYLHSIGLCLGATLNSGVAVDENGVVNPEGLRFNDEFVKHKVLDAVGDLFVFSYPVIGLYTNVKGGHFHNNQLVRKVLADPSNFQIVEL